MAQENKQLLLQELCARLPYGVVIQQSPKYADKHFADKWEKEPHDFNIIGIIGKNTLVTDKNTTERTYAKGIVSKPVTVCIYDELTKQTVRPYLRPMSSMTDEERIEFSKLLVKRYCEEDWEGHISTSYCIEIDNVYTDDENGIKYPSAFSMDAIDWLNKNMFDYRGLIEKGLAIEAPEGMYK